ncbi:Sucrase/ferredoxin-like-domain-containing protein [Aspergillus karnatakaensis]|uniref:Sucrase/ferredoxin-like-domain-containing protein n=1 Tax=Aspergillus karnatakaensis TaxID=1810916 RepID=UPI003CCDFEBF
MAPVTLLARLKSLYSKQEDEPVISAQAAAGISICLTLIYVLPFYISPATRPSTTLSRDAPSVIRARIRAVTLSCIICSLAVLWLIVGKDDSSVLEALELMGWWPISFADIVRSFLLTAILFLGPLFERGVAEGEWSEWLRGTRISETLGSWIGWRNYVAGPITEEVMFRSAIVPLHLLAKVSPGRIVFVAPLYFGVAHVHHFYEFRITHPDTSILASMLRSLFQFGYTTVFGWFATFIYLRTGSLVAVIFIHAFCNWCGLPRLWGRVEVTVPIGTALSRGKEDSERSTEYTYGEPGIGWTVAYYGFLVAGAVGFYYALWPMSESLHALANFTGATYSRRIPLDIPPPFPVTSTCPEPRCPCPPMPSMPDGLPLEHDHPLNGTMAAYAQQILICTGQKDWTSRIEDDGKGQPWGDLVRGLKSLMGRGGPYADPFNNVMVTNSSLPPSSSSEQTASGAASAFLFPSFKYFPSIPVNEPLKTGADLSTFIRAFLLPTQLSPMTETLPEPRHSDLLRKPELAAEFSDAVELHHSPVILICGHGGRDMRCGVMAPILEQQFRAILQTKGIFTPATSDGSNFDSPDRAHIGLISHIGGHKYAGNVIVYIPKDMKYKNSLDSHPLGGKGIWYGRVEPQHVEGIVEETVLGGNVVKDHFRGGIDHDGNILRL